LGPQCLHNTLSLNMSCDIQGFVHNPKGQLLSGPKSRRTQYLGTEGYDNANWAGPWTAWPDMSWYWNGSFPSGPTNVDFFHILGGEDLELSEGHPYRKIGMSSRDIGGDFIVYRQEYEQSPGIVSYDISKSVNPNAAGYHYRGPQFASLSKVGLSDWPDPDRSSFSELKAIGTTAISRCIPTNPIFGLTQFLGELREGIPRLVGTDFFRQRSALARSAGSEYLNVQFGWFPLVSDVRNFAYAVGNSNEILAQYERDSGKRVRRQLTVKDEREVETDSWFGHSACPTPVLTPDFYSSSADTVLTRTRTIKRKQWFSGCFTYYLAPEKSGEQGRKRWLQEANKLFGVRLTPETLWNLTPWSWGVDWFANVGDVLHNASAFANDGLVMPYGYMMEQCSISDHWSNSGFQYKTSGMPSSFTQKFTVTSKQRVKATPFGFGIDLSTLSGRQLAIVSALGLSRSGSIFS
jgi:hypothetical protein